MHLLHYKSASYLCQSFAELCTVFNSIGNYIVFGKLRSYAWGL